MTLGDNAMKERKKSQPADIFRIWFQGTANELHNLSSEQGGKKDEKRLMKHFLAASWTYIRKNAEKG